MPRKKKGKAFNNPKGKTGYADEYDTAYPRDLRQPTLQINGTFPRQFSLQEEARNTESHCSWNSDLKLRHAQVKFVSAHRAQSKESGDLEPIMHHTSFPSTKGPKTDNVDSSKRYLEELHHLHPLMSFSAPVTPLDITSPSVECVNGTARDKRRGVQHADELDGTVELFFTDISGSPDVVRTGLPPSLILRSPSPTGSDSSEEVIVFGGRAGSQRKRPELTSETYYSKFEAERLKRESMVRIHQVGFTPLPSVHISESIASGINPSLRISSVRHNTSVVDPHFRTRNTRENTTPKPSLRLKKQSRGLRRKQHKKDVLADYIANIQAGELNNEQATGCPLNGRNLDGSDHNTWEDEADTSSSDVKYAGLLNTDLEADWSEGNLNDFEELSTSNEILGEIAHVLSKRERASGLQYLIVCEGSTFQEARWIPLSSLDTPSAQQKILLFDKSAEKFKQYSPSSQGTDDSSDLGDLAALDLEEALDDIRDDEDLLKRKQDRTTDEKLARLLSKQEELGLGSDQLVLFDEDDLSETTDTDVFEILRNDAMRISMRGGKKRGRRQGVSGHVDVFADALDQDSYGAFDFMDQGRPSLKRKSKGHRGILPFELSDTELANTMNLNWENDREKKKMRKLEREELRAHGLLGKKDKYNMKAKYPEGMSYSDIKNEIRSFMLSASESIPLPPMDKKDRKSVHDIANVFKLKSKSVGGGNSRFPILYKTSRTIKYNEETNFKVEAQLSRKHFFPNMDKRRKVGSVACKRAARGHSGGGAGAAVSYRDGEIVGGSAPELGTENRGRAMLEKMGWSTGTALGALNNKGIMQPVVHVVKTTKAGLG